MEAPKTVGSKWWKVDFHVHTPFSSDFGHGDVAEKSISPDEWLKAAMEKRLDAVVVTDHNGAGWVDELKNAKERLVLLDDKPDWYRPIAIFPGFEINLSGNGKRIHLLGIFDPERTTAQLTSILGECGIKDKFGECDSCFSEKSIQEVSVIIRSNGGVAVPAHVDAEKGLLHDVESVSNDLDKYLRMLIAVELHDEFQAESKTWFQNIKRMAHVSGSDAHTLKEIGQRTSWIKMGIPTIDALRFALKDKVFCVLPGSEANPNHIPDFHIRQLSVKNLAVCARGDVSPMRLDFNPHITSLIGGRGTGKSTVIESLRFVFRRDSPRKETEGMAVKWENFSRSMLRLDTRLQADVHSHGKDFRINWNGDGSGPVLEELRSDGWHETEAGDIENRFPIGIYSQKQILSLAENPGGLLALIDSSDEVDRTSWNARWSHAKSDYIHLCMKERELRNRRDELGKLSTRISDLDQKIAECQKKGFGDVLRRVQRFSRQDRLTTTGSELMDIAESLEKSAEQIVVPDFPYEEFDAADQKTAELVDGYLALQSELTLSQTEVVRAANRMKEAMARYSGMKRRSVWQRAYDQCRTEYELLAKDLSAKGEDFNPQMYGRWISERAQLSSDFGKLQSVENELKQVVAEIKEKLNGLVALRRELHSKRLAFINSTIGDNKYVRMSLDLFGDVSTIEQDVRDILGIEPERFQGVLYNEDEHTGLLSELVEWRECGRSADELPQMISDFKSKIWSVVHGTPSDYHASFDKRLVSLYQSHPSSMNELSAYWPEDRLNVEYSVGAKFHPLEQGASGGQKSAAVLAFLLSYGTYPLVIDQPEDDLDNSLVMDLVVRQMQEGRGKRQVIVATHNPNIVINGDSELVTVMKFANGMIYVKRQGALDDMQIRTDVCQIMEGGRTAFKKRFARMIGDAENA